MSNDLLQKAIQLAKSQNREAAIPLLVHILKAEPENVEAWSSLLDMLADDQRRAVLAALVHKNLGGPAAREVLDQISAEDLKPYLAAIDHGSRDVDLDAPVAVADDPAQDSQAEWLPESETAFDQTAPTAPDAAQSNPTDSPAPGAMDDPPPAQATAQGEDNGSTPSAEQPDLPAAEPVEPVSAAETQPVENADALDQLRALAVGEGGEPEKQAGWKVEWLPTEPVAQPAPAFPPPQAAVRRAVSPPSDPGPAFSTPVTRRARRRSQANCLLLVLAGLLVVIAAVAGLALLSLRGLIILPFVPIVPTAVSVETAAPVPSATTAQILLPSATTAPTAAPSSTPPPAPTDTPPPTLTPTVFAGQVIQSAVDGASMVYIPSGTFQMGWNYGDPGETTEHKVSLDAYWIDLTEVTNRMYAACVTAGACTPPAESKSYKRVAYYGSAEFDNFPVVYVNWQQAVEYCAWTGRWLPSEAQWEYAARGDDRRLYPWGKNEPSQELANYSFINKDTAQVGSYPAGASPFGVLDMAGNVAEWVQDWYIESYYAQSPLQNPVGPATGSVHAYRGGSFANQADKIRSTRRSYDAPAYVNSSLGFRCAQDAP